MQPRGDNDDKDEVPLEVEQVLDVTADLIGEEEEQEESYVEELVPLQLTRHLAFKRGYAESTDDGCKPDGSAKCRSIHVLRKYGLVLVDGLNGNVDVFGLLDFMYRGTLDINESVMTCVLDISDAPPHANLKIQSPLLFIGTQEKMLFVFEIEIQQEQSYIENLFTFVTAIET